MARAKKKDKNEEEKPGKINYDELIRAHLSNIQTGPGREKMGYTHLNLMGKHLERPLDSLPSSFSNYTLLLHIDVSFNSIPDQSTLATLPNLITVNAKRNMISSTKAFNKEPVDGEEVEYWKSLQSLDMSGNKISELGPMRCPNLLHLDLSQNDIKKLENFDGHPKLEFLDQSSNGVVDTTSISKMPMLQKLYLGFNKIKTMNGFDGLDSLIKLHMKSNLLNQFDEAFPPIETQEQLNLRSNRIEKIEEIEKLASLPKLKRLTISFNPFVEKNPSNYIFQIIVKFPNLIKINKTDVTRIVRLQTLAYQKELWLEQKRIEEEEKRKEEEEALKNEGND